jgi:acyl carrier protein
VSALERIAALSEAQRAELARRLRAARGAAAHLAAYLETAPGAELTAEEVRAYLLERLPASIVPSTVVFLDALPLLPSGKLDRSVLPEPAAGREAGAEAPRSPAEATIAAIFRDVLGVESPGVHDTFWSLGGQSVVASSIMGRVREAFGVRLPVRALFDNPTVAALAARVEAAARAPAAPPAPAAGRQPALSTAQRRVWLQQKLSPDSVALNVVAALRARGPLDAGALERAIGEIARRHDVLRTAYDEDRGVPRPEVAPWAPLPLHVLTVAGEDAVMPALVAEARRPFDLARPPQLRATLIEVGEDDHVLTIASHHVAADKAAFGVLFRELSELYGAFAAGRPSSLPPLHAQYADYAAWEADLLERGLDAGLEHWRRRLATAPTGSPFAAAGAASGATGARPVAVPEATAVALAAATARQGTSVFAAALASFASALRRLIGRRDLVLTVPTSSRGAAEWEGLVGCFVNPVALHIDASVGASPGALLRWAHEAMLDANTHSHVPFELVVNAVRAERQAGGEPLSHVVLNFTEALRPPELGGARVELLDAGALSLAKNDLTLYLDSGPGSLRGRFVYAEEALSAGAVEALAGDFLAMLGTLAAGAPEPAQPPSRPHAGLDPGRLVTTAGDLPLVVEPAAGLDLVRWVRANRGQVERWVEAHGAVLFRGFGVHSRAFEQVSRVLTLGLSGRARFVFGERDGGELRLRRIPDAAEAALRWRDGDLLAADAAAVEVGPS